MRVLPVALAVLVLGGCAAADGPGGEPGDSPAAPVPDVSGTITVFAAASLTEAFDALALEFEQLHPAAEVVLNYGGSSALATQITEGAPADVFAAANEPTMQTVVDAGGAGDPVLFAGNTLQIAVPAGNPAGVDELADFADGSLVIAICDPAVPCGAASQQLFDQAGIVAAPDTLEADVKSVLTKVELGEADTGLVYVTDVIAAGDAVEGVDLPESEDALNRYPIAVLADAPNTEGGQAWVDFVLSDAGQQVLADAGFVAP